MARVPVDALHETWESVYDLSVQLTKRVREHCLQTGEQFDAIVVVPRGSYYPVNIVARELGFSAVDLLHTCIGSYHDGAHDRTGEFQLGQMPTDEQVAGKSLLIIEEVCDTGLTLDFLVKRLKVQGAALIRTGVLHYKPKLSQSGFVPDWYVAKTDKWIVYPWEMHEQTAATAGVKRAE